MDPQRNAGTSRRWHAPTWDSKGRHWTARVRYRVADRERVAGVEPVVYGPTWSACVAETMRIDRMWSEFPRRTGNPDGTLERLAFLAGGAV